jgi:hypothetical protein
MLAETNIQGEKYDIEITRRLFKGNLIIEYELHNTNTECEEAEGGDTEECRILG